MLTKKLEEVIKLLHAGVITSPTIKNYKLTVKNEDSIKMNTVELKLYFKRKLVLTIKEGIIKNKTIECSKKEHRLLMDLKINAIYYEQDFEW